MKKIIQQLQYGENATMVPTWTNTEYKTLAEARQANPREPGGFFRIKRVEAGK